ncbi:uncharacterized protein LOC111343242 [Stylophora pistillata]|uniref:uncharacterized protein LOC111343242 n=1 Tax=Stylophora pistillata TaxID=50429 RepID=UPI000C04E0B5|nr:uncharacterized protein LOC111343242 [Stylophora pistillata]
MRSSDPTNSGKSVVWSLVRHQEDIGVPEITFGKHTSSQNSDKNLKKNGDEFLKANVTSGAWIFYTYANFNDKEAGSKSSNYKVVQPGADVDISAVNGSMFLLPDQVEGILLFEHNFYGGGSKWFEESCPDVNPYFPSGKGGGVSSVIVLSKEPAFCHLHRN